MSTPTFVPPTASEYGYQSVITGPAPRPEPAHVAPARMEADAIVTRFGLSCVEDIDAHLKAFGFPAATGWVGRVHHYENGGVAATTRTVYSEDKVREWEHHILALADRIRQVR